MKDIRIWLELTMTVTMRKFNGAGSAANKCKNVTKNLPPLLEELQNELADIFYEMPLKDEWTLWFQYDGAPIHSISEAQSFLHRTIYGVWRVDWVSISPWSAPPP